MKLIKTMLTILALTAIATSGFASSHGEGQQHSHGDMEKGKGNMDKRINSWVKDVCGDDVACAEKKRAHYKDRMAKYNKRAQEKCGDDKECRKEMHDKYMERRAKKEARINEHCGDDQACRNKLREEYRKTMDEARAKCGEDKDCWEKFYAEKKPK